MTNFPNVWGEENFFGFSGLDGKTDWNYPFIATLLKDKLGFTIRTDREKRFWLAIRKGNRVCETLKGRSKNCFEYFKPDIVSGDIISLNAGFKKWGFHLLALPVSKEEFILRITPETSLKDSVIYFISRVEACKKLYCKDKNFVIVTDKDKTFIKLNRKTDDYSVVDSTEEVDRIIRKRAIKRAKEWDGDKEVRYLVISYKPKSDRTLDISISTKKQGKKKRVRSIPTEKKRKYLYIERAKGFRNSTLAKAFSILKANIESPQGVFKQRWSTPDRWPHRHLWLWDSCFHSLGYVFIDKNLAEETLLSVLDIQQENGFIPHIGRPNGDFSNITQPPLLSWAVHRVYHYSKNKKFLLKCYPKLKNYLKWHMRNRDKNRNGLLEWARNDESGMDNSSRFNYGCNFDAVDFSAFIVNDLKCFYYIGKELGKENAEVKKLADKIAKKIEIYLWNRKEGFFFDRYFERRFSSYKTACGFLPLFAGVANNNQAEKLVRHLKNKNEFNTPFPIPGEAMDSPTFDNNMWRGPVWLNYNYFIIEGLKNYGFFDLAETIRKKTMKEVERWYRKEGTIFEFYDPFGKLSPKKIPRKDRYGAIKEFGWSAAIYIVLSMMPDFSR